MKIVKTIDHYIEKFCAGILVACILSILVFSSMTIILRWFQINLMWIDPMVRHLVFLSTFLGGVIATGRGTHIGIDLVSKIVEVKGWTKAQITISRIIYLSSALGMVWLFKSGYDFTRVEFEFAKKEFFGISSGFLVSIIPFGVFLIGFRFLAMFIATFSEDYRPQNIHISAGATK
jgi:TRAP-type C4-dicarboxylate transport system permease small subunit